MEAVGELTDSGEPKDREGGREEEVGTECVWCIVSAHALTHTHALVHHRPLAISLVTLLHAAFRRTA